MSEIGLYDDVSRIRGIGSRKKERLEALGIRTAGDLLRHYPVRYRDRRRVIPVSCVSDDQDVMVSGFLTRVNVRTISGGRTVTECMLRDDSSVFSAVFFNMPYLSKSLRTGTVYIICGRKKTRNGLAVWTNPEMYPEGSNRDRRGILPVYRHTAGITDANLSAWIRSALSSLDPETEWISGRILEKRRLCGLFHALCNIHFPKDERHYKTARYRVIYDQLLTYQLALRISRRQNEDPAYDSSVPPADIDKFIADLPFTLTRGQLDCIADIERDLGEKRPMNRLIQGDVGCGKTVVAEAAIYRCASAGLQSAMMAPTELLARQHYERLSKDLGRYGIKTELLVSGMKTEERRAALERISSGESLAVTGTHALIQKDVRFNDLALVVTDEQHRFGVNQRKILTRKGRGVNIAVMSATPIPRTMAATVFGDMDFSIIRSRPADRKAVITRALDPGSREKAYTAVRKEIEAGNRAYIVAPSIDSEEEDISSVNSLYEEVRRRFRGHNTGLLHGRMERREKEAVMADFAAGRYDILVATVVIEVGIDVPEATVIVIENSERFGLAQLHQLRGRVGRSSRQSYCYLINYGRSETAAARARAMARISDGFEISEADYRLRGPGDIAGTMQSGSAMKNILALSSYTDILEAASEDADSIMSDPEGTDLEAVYEYMERTYTEDNSDVI